MTKVNVIGKALEIGLEYCAQFNGGFTLEVRAIGGLVFEGAPILSTDLREAAPDFLILRDDNPVVIPVASIVSIQVLEI